MNRQALLWSVRREVWENRSLYIAPLGVAVLILIGFAISFFGVGWHSALSSSATGEQPYTFAALLLMMTTFLVGIVYCLDALYGERRDRSILFWKSLPVSDVTAVLAKACIPLVLLPLLTFVVTVVTQVLMLGLGPHVPFWSMTAMLFNHLVLGHGFWYAPIWGWLLLCSAWARRVPYLWATLPLLALGLVERIAFNTSYLAGWLEYRFLGGPGKSTPGAEPMTMAAITHASTAEILSSRGFWSGLALFAVFVALAVQLRRRRGAV